MQICPIQSSNHLSAAEASPRISTGRSYRPRPTAF